MKFAHSVFFNAVSDWRESYIAYSNLKKFIYELEQHANRGTRQENADPEASSLLRNSEDGSFDKTFSAALDEQLEKITEFYRLKEAEIHAEADSVLAAEIEHEEDVTQLANSTITLPTDTSSQPNSPLLNRCQTSYPRSRRTRTRTSSIESNDSNAESETAPLQQIRTIDTARLERYPADLRRRRSLVYNDHYDMTRSSLQKSGRNLKKSLVRVYASLCELRSFIDLNREGFSKVLKKYDKTLDRLLKLTYLAESVEPCYVFLKSTRDRLSAKILSVEEAYCKLVTNGNLDLAQRELRLHLREHVVWQRDTVWREMIGMERKVHAAKLGLRQPMLGGDSMADDRNAILQGDSLTTTLRSPRIGSLKLPFWLVSRTLFTLLAISVVFLVLLFKPLLAEPEQQNCLAMVVFVSLLWATEAIPLFVTSLMVPFLAVVLRIPRSGKTGRRLSTKAATSYIFSAMWTPTIMLLLGGFTIAAALSKHNIAKRMATLVLSQAGTTPRTVLLATMFVATFASMWISNVAAPVLCISIIQPILRNLPAGSNMSKALIMGIALASNIGGAASPISSPQNLIALENMSPEPGWGIWFFIALPVCIISNILIWLLLLLTFQPGKNTTIVPIRIVKDPLTGLEWFVSMASLGTIVLWCLSHQLTSIFGDMGVIAIVPMLLFFGTGVLTKEDFNNFLWTIIILAAGGLALGKAVNSSGLLHTLAAYISSEVDGLGLYSVTIVFSLIILVVATFISHTVAALIFLPLVRQVGQDMQQPHPNLLVMAGVLMCSAAMGLPTSGFPNMTAIMAEDSQTGKRYLGVKHFISRGVPSSLMVFIVVITLGYWLMLLVSF